MSDQSTSHGQKEGALAISRTPSVESWDFVNDPTSGGMRSKRRESDGRCLKAGLARGSPPPKELGHASGGEAKQHNPDDRTRADYLRNKLCMTRIQVDCERDKYTNLHEYAQESIGELVAFLCRNANLAAAPPSTAQEFRRLQKQVHLAKDALSTQFQTTRGAEADLRDLEDQISGLGVWYVHLPDMQM